MIHAERPEVVGCRDEQTAAAPKHSSEFRERPWRTGIVLDRVAANYRIERFSRMCERMDICHLPADTGKAVARRACASFGNRGGGKICGYERDRPLPLSCESACEAATTAADFQYRLAVQISVGIQVSGQEPMPGRVSVTICRKPIVPVIIDRSYIGVLRMFHAHR